MIYAFVGFSFTSKKCMVHNAKQLSAGQIIFLAIELRKIPVTTSDDAVSNAMQSGSVLLRQGDTSVYIYSWK
jgi:hypothetical protein